MLVDLRDITTIKPYVQNPRVNDSAVDAVANSIREFGFRQPIVVVAQMSAVRYVQVRLPRSVATPLKLSLAPLL
jgi:ParB-like chromosome segregation protein Spo0J